MKKEFLLAERPEERLVIAVCAANTAWSRTGANSALPSEEFYEDFLEPFIEYEFKKLRLDEVHLISQSISTKRERELTEAMAYWSKKCIEKLSNV